MICKTSDNLFSQRSWCSVLFQEMLVEIYDPSTVFLAYKNAKFFQKADNSSVVIERQFLQRTAGVGAEVAVVVLVRGRRLTVPVRELHCRNNRALHVVATPGINSFNVCASFLYTLFVCWVYG
jgi:hypothetical protein